MIEPAEVGRFWAKAEQAYVVVFRGDTYYNPVFQTWAFRIMQPYPEVIKSVPRVCRVVELLFQGRVV